MSTKTLLIFLTLVGFTTITWASRNGPILSHAKVGDQLPHMKPNREKEAAIHKVNEEIEINRVAPPSPKSSIGSTHGLYMGQGVAPPSPKFSIGSTHGMYMGQRVVRPKPPSPYWPSMHVVPPSPKLENSDNGEKMKIKY